MPKKLLTVFILVLLVSFSLSSLANAQQDIKLVINGAVVDNDLDYKIVNHQILVPVDVIIDNLDVKAKWFRSIDTLQLKSKNKVIKLRIGDQNLQVNDKVVKMPVATRVIESRPMVPLKNIGQALGLKINSNPQQRVVKLTEVNNHLQGIKHQKTDKYERVALQVSGQADYRVDFLRQPNRIVFDLVGTTIPKEISNLDPNSQLIKKVRLAQFNSNTVRLVLDIVENVDYQIKQRFSNGSYHYFIEVSPIITGIDYNGSNIKINATHPLESSSISYLSNPERAIIDINNAALDQKQIVKVNNSVVKQFRISQYQTKPHNVVRAVLDLKKKATINTKQQDNTLSISMMNAQLTGLKYSDDHKHKLSLKLNKSVKPEVIPLTKGNRLIFDLPNTVNKVTKEHIPVDDKLIEEIRVSQFDSQTTRVVVDLVQFVPYQMDYKEDNTLEIKFMNRLLDLNLVQKGTNMNLDLSLLATGNYKVYKLFKPNRLVIDMMNTVVNKENINLPNPSGIVKDVRVSQYSTKPQQTRVVLELDREFSFKGNSKAITENINIDISKFDSVGRVIVVDAGHGGHDPGALGFSVLREKDVVLDIALKLEKLLEKTGARVVMTRKSDHFVELGDRTKLANNLNADLFVSIHVNAHREKDNMGSETYVAPGSSRASLRLAKEVQGYLVNKLNTLDRGVKQGDLYVLNHTHMPAILAEIAFISNKKEEKLLMQDEFKTKAARALYEGISNYFDSLSEEEF